MKPPAKLETLPAVAAAFDRTPRQVRTWIAQGCPRPPCARHDVERWLRARERARAKKSRGRANTAEQESRSRHLAELLRWRTEFRRARAELEAHALAERRGELVETARVAELFASRIGEVRGSLRAMEQSIPLLFDPGRRREIADAIAAEWRAFCTAMFEGRDYVAEGAA